LEYSVSWDERTEEDLRRIDGRPQAIIRKIRNLAKTLPDSLKLKGVQPIVGAANGYYEVDVGKNRVAIFVDHDCQRVQVCFLASHDVFHGYLRDQQLNLRNPPL